jgi:hypothetical protein
MSVEVKVTRTVPDSVWTEALKALFDDLIHRAHGYATAYAPTDKGKLKQSLAPQAAGKMDGGAWPQWASYGPKITNPPYAGYLNAGSYTRTWVPPKAAIQRWGKLKSMAADDAKGIWGGMFHAKPKVVHYHYVGQPESKPPDTTSDQYGLRTAGWFNPSVVTAMTKGGDMDRAADAFAARIERAWNG